MMTEKQANCIKFIEGILPVRFRGNGDGHKAWEFIKDNLAAARKESARQEREADRFILGAVTGTPATVYDAAISFHDIPARTETRIDLMSHGRRDDPLRGLTTGLLSGT